MMLNRNAIQKKKNEKGERKKKGGKCFRRERWSILVEIAIEEKRGEGKNLGHFYPQNRKEGRKKKE